jgi:hypothetical protein
MCPDPTDKKMNLLFPKNVMTDHPVIISANIKYHSTTAVTQQVGGTKCAQNVVRVGPIRAHHSKQPKPE